MDTSVSPTTPPRPSMAEIDVFGLTHPGHVRAANNDHFLVASFHRHLRVHGTSIPGGLHDEETESRGFLLLVADGVGSLASAGEGSALALTTLTRHLLHATELCSHMAISDEAGAAEALREAVMRAHGALLERGNDDHTRPATTLTMFAAFWPRAFVVHVGDSRMYRLRGDDFTCFTSDQTYEQLMVESGAVKPGTPAASRLKHMLWSAVGNEDIVPQVIPIDLKREDVNLLCTDGLTKHVTDDEIRQHLTQVTSSEATCRALVDLALSRGGTDNVTVVIGRTRARNGATA